MRSAALRFRHVSSVILLLLPLALTQAHADPPARVGRLSFLSGSVSFRPGSLDDWSAAALNYPVTTGDHLWTDEDAKAELHVGSTAVRLAPYTAFGVLNLDDQTAQLQMTQGSLQIRIRTLGPQESYEVDTPNASIALLRPGLYLIDVDSTGDTTDVTVRDGEAEVTASGSAFTVRPRQLAEITGQDAPSYDLRDAGPTDAWEDWCAVRDRREDNARSSRFVSREMVGYEDLDDYGDWRTVDSYGAVWVPSHVDPDWAPYRFGHWAWVEPWGWTWIDDAPWGFAPFHYGRWVHYGYGWAWVPGRVAPRPVYAPALVAFVGGSGWSVSLSFGGGGGAAWFPLAPEEPYLPAYRVTPAYVQRVNVTNVTVVNVTNVNVTNVHYVNRDVPGAVTAVSQETIVSGRPVAVARVNVPPANLTGAPVAGTAPRFVPRQESVVGTGAGGPARTPPTRAFERPIVARTQPPLPPVKFQAERTQLAANGGRPLDDDARNRLRGNGPAPTLVRPASAGGQGAAGLHPARANLPTTRPVEAATWSKPAPQAAPRRSDRPPAAQGNPQGAPGGVRGNRQSGPGDLANRQNAERQQLDSQQAAERNALAKRHQDELKRPPDGVSSEDLKNRHAQEQQALDQRHKQQRDSLAQRHSQENARQGKPDRPRDNHP